MPDERGAIEDIKDFARRMAGDDRDLREEFLAAEVWFWRVKFLREARANGKKIEDFYSTQK